MGTRTRPTWNSIYIWKWCQLPGCWHGAIIARANLESVICKNPTSRDELRHVCWSLCQMPVLKELHSWWFKVTFFFPLVGGHLTFPKGHLTIPKRALWITWLWIVFFCWDILTVVFFAWIEKASLLTTNSCDQNRHILYHYRGMLPWMPGTH